MNTTVEAFKLPEWRKVPHDAEHFFLTGAPFMDTEFFPKRLRLERNMWTDNDRNMSHFFMKTYTDFARYGNPTPQQVLGIHFDVAKDGELKYLNLNTTYNSSILLNFRQTESAFWTQVITNKNRVIFLSSVANQFAFSFSFSVFAGTCRQVSAHLSAIYGILVGATGTAPNSILEHDWSMPIPYGYCCHVLHTMAKCQEVN